MKRSRIKLQEKLTPKSSDPIPIKAPAKNEKHSDNESEYNSQNDDELYGLKLNIFDPNKFSPPNSWNNRLVNRLNTYSSTPY